MKRGRVGYLYAAALAQSMLETRRSCEQRLGFGMAKAKPEGARMAYDVRGSKKISPNRRRR